MPFELIKSETLLTGRVFTIQRDHVKTPDGRQTTYDIIHHGGSVLIVPIDQDGNLLFVRQYRHAARKDLLELPAGTLDEGESPQVCAARELREETGFAAGRLDKIGEFYLAPGYSSEYMTVFIARDLKPDPLEHDVDEFLTLEKIPVERAIELATRGEFPDAKTLAGLFFALPLLRPLL